MGETKNGEGTYAVQVVTKHKPRIPGGLKPVKCPLAAFEAFLYQWDQSRDRGREGRWRRRPKGAFRVNHLFERGKHRGRTGKIHSVQIYTGDKGSDGGDRDEDNVSVEKVGRREKSADSAVSVTRRTLETQSAQS